MEITFLDPQMDGVEVWWFSGSLQAVVAAKFYSFQG